MVEATDTAAVCAVCGGTGWLLEASDGRKLAHPCVCRGAAISRARLDAAGIPQRYRDCTLENFSDNTCRLTKARAAARDFVDAYPAVEAGLLLTGPGGPRQDAPGLRDSLGAGDDEGRHGPLCRLLGSPDEDPDVLPARRRHLQGVGADAVLGGGGPGSRRARRLQAAPVGPRRPLQPAQHAVQPQEDHGGDLQLRGRGRHVRRRAREAGGPHRLSASQPSLRDVPHGARCAEATSARTFWARGSGPGFETPDSPGHSRGWRFLSSLLLALSPWLAACATRRPLRPRRCPRPSEAPVPIPAHARGRRPSRPPPRACSSGSA